MKILIVGSGGREHAIAEKIAMNPSVEKIYAAPGNGGMASFCELVPIAATDVGAMTAFAKSHGVDFAVVTPDDPLCLGMVDAMNAEGIACFGPEQKAAMIEGSKVFAKELMRKYGIPTARYAAFDDFAACEKYIREEASCPVVVKADGLALGKGVLICPTKEMAISAARGMMREARFGDAGRRVVVEEFLEGPEVSVLAFTDGDTLIPMVSSMDHKRALDGDEGLNTGGMGTVAPNPYYTPEVAARAMREIFLPTLAAMRSEGRTFRGCLYFGLMITKDGPKVIEYNCRFGDPETQVVLPLMESDLLTAMLATAKGTLAQTEVKFSTDCACCVVIASGGYPVKYDKGFPISGLEAAGEGAHVYHAGTKLAGGKIVTSGGRVLGVTATAPSLREAIAKAYAAAEKIHFENCFMRHDIGQRALKAEEKA